MTRPHGAEAARCKGFRGRAVLGLLGPMRLSRHDYHCPHCGRGTCPQDGGLGQQGPGGKVAEGRMAYVGRVYNPVPEDRARRADPRGPWPAWQAR